MMATQQDEREYRTIRHLVDVLADMCSANSSKIIDLLSDYLFTAEEAAGIKNANKHANYTDREESPQEGVAATPGTREIEMAMLITAAMQAVTTVAPIADVRMHEHDGVLLYQFVIDADIQVVIKAESAMLNALTSRDHCESESLICFSCGIRI